MGICRLKEFERRPHWFSTFSGYYEGAFFLIIPLPLPMGELLPSVFSRSLKTFSFLFATWLSIQTLNLVGFVGFRFFFSLYSLIQSRPLKESWKGIWTCPEDSWNSTLKGVLNEEVAFLKFFKPFKNKDFWFHSTPSKWNIEWSGITRSFYVEYRVEWDNEHMVLLSIQ